MVSTIQYLLRSAKRNPLKVLLACDDAPMRRTLRSLLRGHPGIQLVAVMADGQRAVEKALQLGPDVVVISASIPVLDGIELNALKSLSARERQILRLAADGKSNAQMAEDLSLSPRTIETYRASLMRKLALNDVPSLVKFAIRHGMARLA